MLGTLHSVGNKNSHLFLFSLKLKTSFLVCLAPFLFSRGLNLSVVNHQNRGKLKKKWSPLYVMDIMSQTLHYRHHIIDIMLWTLWLHDFNNGNSFGRNKCYMQFCSNLSHTSFQCFWLNTNNHNHNNNCTLAVATPCWHEEYKFSKSWSPGLN